MQSSFKVIKSSYISNEGRKDINTNFIKAENNLISVNNNMESYENIGNTIISEAKKKSELILSNTYQELEKMQKEVHETAYREGFEKGLKEGFEKAYEDAYKKNIEEIQVLKEKADKMLLNCVEESNIYIKNKESDIKALIQNAIESILKTEVKDKESMNSVIADALDSVKDTSTFIIKCNSLYYSEIKSNVQIWKEKLPFSGEIFVISDDSLSNGSVVIKRDNGKSEISIQDSLDKIKEILYSEE